MKTSSSLLHAQCVKLYASGWYSTKSASERLGTCQKTIQRHINAYKLAHLPLKRKEIGKQILYKLEF